jgi:nicotinate dehydrogenase subunit A
MAPPEDGGRPAALRITVNGADHAVVAAPQTPLLYVLRNDLALNGPKYGCGLGECGACAVLVGDRSVRACATPVAAVAGRAVTTLEGLGTIEAPHPVQAAFIAEAAAQCGYCLNGMIIATVALLRRTPDPTEGAIREALRHHLCRCGTHMEILAAVRRAAAAGAREALP